MEKYCHFCGSNKLINSVITESADKHKEFNPKISVLKTSVQFGKIGKQHKLENSHSSQICNLCRNENEIKLNTDLKPMIISNKSMKIVIPTVLFNIFDVMQYKKKDVECIMKDNEDKLMKIFKKWIKFGQNKCKDGRMGEKMKISLESDIYVWVIIDGDHGINYHLSYSGGKIICP